MELSEFSSSTKVIKSNYELREFLGRLLRNNKGWLFVAPALALWLFVGLYSVVFSIVLAFHRWTGFSNFSFFPTYVCEAPTCRFVGLDNFTTFLTPNTPPFNQFVGALRNNLLFMAIGTPATIIIALLLAMALNHAGRGIRFFRTLMLLPMVTAGIAVYYVWSLIYQPQGLLNNILKLVGLEAVVMQNGWLGDIRTALVALVVIVIWSGVPFAMLLYLAGLQTIPGEVTEASIVDGASPFERFVHIIWPLLRPVTIIVIITSISSILQGYELPLLMTDGGPTNHTMVAGLIIYKTAFGGWGTPNLGLASAYGWVLFLFGLGISALSLRSMRTLDNQE